MSKKKKVRIIRLQSVFAIMQAKKRRNFLPIRKGRKRKEKKNADDKNRKKKEKATVSTRTMHF